MQTIVDLARYPLDRSGSPEWLRLVERCRSNLAADGLFNLPGFLLPGVAERVTAELRPVLQDASFTHAREHNIYFKPSIDGLAADHPALQRFRTVNRTVCADQILGCDIIRLYEWPEFAVFLAAVMGKPVLHAMADPLARVNVMAYSPGEALNWHFDRSEFTTTLLLQAPDAGGAFEYAQDLRTDGDPNYEGVARLLCGDHPTVVMPLEAGTLNIFRGRNTAHRVTPVEGASERIIAVFSYFETEGTVFSEEERIGFYGRPG